MILALILFIITYLLMMIFSTKREIIVIISSILFTLLGIINFKEAITAINYDALLIIIGVNVRRYDPLFQILFHS